MRVWRPARCRCSWCTYRTPQYRPSVRPGSLRRRVRGMLIAPATTLGEVRLTVSDLERSVGYYRTAIGLDVIERAGGRATLGAGSTALLVLVEEPGARPSYGHTGLF